MKTFKRINRKLLDILSFSDEREQKINEGITLLSEELRGSIYLLDNNYEFFGNSSRDLDIDYFTKFKNTDIQRDNVIDGEKVFIVSPLVSSREFVGMLIVKREEKFSEEEIIVFEMFRNFAITAIYNIYRDRNFKTQRQINIVKNSISSFSYSELHAIVAIFNELGGEEGVVIASNVSEKYSVTRSVIVSALRKFESSGVIESRSLGAKGTFIKVLNPYLIQELDKMKSDFLNKK